MMIASRTRCTPFTAVKPSTRPVARRSVQVQAAWTKVATEQELKAANGKLVVDVAGQRVLLAQSEGTVYAVSNKCSHLGLPLVGKTALFQGEISNKCVTCPAHGTKFDLATGKPEGEWCPKLPSFLRVPGAKDLPTFAARVEGGAVEIEI